MLYVNILPLNLPNIPSHIYAFKNQSISGRYEIRCARLRFDHRGFL